MQCGDSDASQISCSVNDRTGVSVAYSIDRSWFFREAARASIEAGASINYSRAACYNMPAAVQGTYDMCTNTATLGFFGFVDPTAGTVTLFNKCRYATKDGKFDVKVKMSDRGITPGLVLLREIQCGGERDHQRALFDGFVPTDVGGLCPVMGNMSVLHVDAAGCAQASRVGQCRYSLDTIAGGCTTKACVHEGIKQFTDAVCSLSGAKPDGVDAVCTASGPTALGGVQRVMQDTLLASMLDGLRNRMGACGDAHLGKTCLAKLEGECDKLFDAATDMQRRGRSVLYEAFRKAGEMCVSESGERDR